MAYNSAGLICLSNTSINSQWILRTVDALGGVDAAGYVTDAGPANSGKGAPGRGMKVGDVVYVQVVDDVTALAPTITAMSVAVCTAVSASTGAGTLLFEVTTAP
jgi:hypothetical protein